MTNRYITTTGVGIAALTGALLAGCQSAPPLPPTSPEVVGEFRAGSGYLRGYLDRKALIAIAASAFRR